MALTCQSRRPLPAPSRRRRTSAWLIAARSRVGFCADEGDFSAVPCCCSSGGCFQSSVIYPPNEVEQITAPASPARAAFLSLFFFFPRDLHWVMYDIFQQREENKKNCWALICSAQPLRAPYRNDGSGLSAKPDQNRHRVSGCSVTKGRKRARARTLTRTHTCVVTSCGN